MTHASMDVDDFGQLCMGCMRDKGDEWDCPSCGYQLDRHRSPYALPYQAVLNNKFLVGRILGKPGGFGLTYLAWDLVLHTTVAIKEYLPRDLVGRGTGSPKVTPHSRSHGEEFAYGLGQFLREARTLSKFSHPNVVRVREFFQQNNTAYLVMDYYEGISLEEYLGREGGLLSESVALELMAPILDGLAEVHAKGFLHRDIKPSNIYLTKGGVPILLDFGAARQALQGQLSQPLSVVLTPGFAPFEQYLDRTEFGPTVDIYAVGATLYYLLTGLKPQPAPDRFVKDQLMPPDQRVPGLSPRLSRAIMAALAIDQEARPQTVHALRERLLAPEPEPAPQPTAIAPEPPVRPLPLPAIRHWVAPVWRWGALGLGLALLLAGLAWFFWRNPSPLPAVSPVVPEELPVPHATPGSMPIQRPFAPPYPPPADAIDACRGKTAGLACTMPAFPGEAERHGVCQQIHAYFACVPAGLPAPPPLPPE